MPASPAPRPRETFGMGPRWRWLRRYFGFSRGETRGFIGLLLLMLGAAVLPRLLRPAAPVYDPGADQRALNQLVAQLQAGRAPAGPDYAAYPRPAGEAGRYAGRGGRFAPVALVPFDPNQLTARDWEARGVPHFVAGRIEKYGRAAGGFKAKTQLRRIYGLPDSVYQRLAPFVLLPDELPRRDYASASRPDFAGSEGRPGFAPFSAGKFPRKPRNLAPFDLNKADTTQLMQIRGIGAGRAKWIVRRRDELGGFVSEAQLADVFGLRDAPDLQDSLRKYTFVAAGFQPAQLNVNTATFEEMALHPYIGKRLGRVIVAFRKQHPPFQQAEDLRQIRILSEEDLAKMRPYVRFE